MIRNSHVSFSFNEILDKDKYAVQSLDSKDRSEGESRITNYVKALITEKFSSDYSAKCFPRSGLRIEVNG